MNIFSKPTRVFQLGATIAALALPAIVVSPIASAKDVKVDGVSAQLKADGMLEVSGHGRDNAIALRLQRNNTSVIQVDAGDDGSADFSFARSDIAAIDVKGAGGDDSIRIDDSNGSFTNTIPTTIEGNGGDDTLTGGLGAETFKGDGGNDVVVGGKGADVAQLDGGNDTFVWNNGDGSDTIEGNGGNDTMVFNGAPGVENVTMSANGSQLKFFRTQGNVTMDTDSVETVDFNAIGGADTVDVGDLSATDVRQVNLDLAGTFGGVTGDGAVDSVTVHGTAGDDNVSVTGGGSSVGISGLSAAVAITHADPTDTLALNTLPGNDSVLTQGLTGVIQASVNGAPI
jgi:hemolysin type calcium-binding protein